MEGSPTHCRIITAVHHTILLQKEIDSKYPMVEESPITF